MKIKYDGVIYWMKDSVTVDLSDVSNLRKNAVYAVEEGVATKKFNSTTIESIIDSWVVSKLNTPHFDPSRFQGISQTPPSSKGYYTYSNTTTPESERIPCAYNMF